MKRILVVFGTRPEAVKLCPVVVELKRREGVETAVCVTAQHREMLDGALGCFGVVPDFDLDLMKEGQSLSELTARAVLGVSEVIVRWAPDAVLVHGDTTTAFAASLAAFYKGVPVGHVEAGLRTGDLLSPFPEEFNRMAVGLVAKWHFAPTDRARDNLLKEGKDEKSIFVTGNTVVDALKFTVRADFCHPVLDWAKGRRLIFLTVHRRESLGEPMREMLLAVRKAVSESEDVALVCPAHKNPEVERNVRELLAPCKNALVCPPLGVADCHNILARSFAALTDSGGIQEEATALGVPTLVLRDKTERQEGVEVGTLRLVGRDGERIYKEIRRLLEDGEAYNAMKNNPNPFGDGTAAQKVGEIVSEE